MVGLAGYIWLPAQIENEFSCPTLIFSARFENEKSLWS